MSTISPQQSQYYKELVTPFQPMGRLLVGADLRGTKCDRAGNGYPRLVGYGDSSGGYAFSPKNQDAAIAPSVFSSNLSNIANSLPRLTEVQDNAGRFIESITLHALDEFIEQTEPQSFVPNILRFFSGEQRGFRQEGTGNRSNNALTLLAEVPIPALTRADIPRSFTVRVGVYIPPSQNIYLGLAIEQPYSVSFELWDLQANTQVGSGFSNSVFVGEGNDLNESIDTPPVDNRFVLPIRFASATWVSGINGEGVFPPPPSSEPTLSPPPPPTFPPPPPPTSPSPTPGTAVNISKPSEDKDEDQPSPSSNNSSKPSQQPKQANPPASAGCVPPQDCNWYSITSAQSATVDINLNGGTSLCPEGTIARGVVDFETSGSFVLCCGAAAYPPNNLGCSSLIKWSCVSGGTCVQDALGVYDSQAQCQAALVPANYTGGQCATTYNILLTVTATGIRNGVPVTSTVTNGRSFFGPLGSIGIGPISLFPNAACSRLVYNGLDFFPDNPPTSVSFCFAGVGDIPATRYTEGDTPVINSITITRADGLPDNCGNPPMRCP